MEQTMAEHKYHQATLQHLAHLRLDSVPHLGASVLQHQPQVALAEAGLEAHLQHQRQQQAGSEPQQS
jgi:hypothetical protein